ncbi:MAG: arginase family protein [Bacteroidetes bacterium]|nr:arginase family protein [Bacteroidota bacterium]
MNHIEVLTEESLSQLISVRKGETKFGEGVQLLPKDNWIDALSKCNAKFVLLGIPEDIGVRANHGIGGTHTMWLPALKTILNVQQSEDLRGEDIVVLGAFDFSELMEQSKGLSANDLRELVAQIDDLVYPVIEQIFRAKKIPIVIGGGHNNSFPLLKALSRFSNSPVNCINLDAHSDYRKMEGRHSGNGFRYARVFGFLKRYALVCLHRNYNASQIVSEISADENIVHSFYEDIFISQVKPFSQMVQEAVEFTKGSVTGIELDVDSIVGALASATTPCGISSVEARQFLTYVGTLAEIGYLHIAEGATELADGRKSIENAKLIAYLVTDFIRSVTGRMQHIL